MTICSIKFFECDPSMWKYKGRIVFRGDAVKDQDGAAAVFQELSASPTSIQDANAAIAYGMLPGHKITVADAIRAYIQSLLKSKHKTWVRIPRELWPIDGSWEGRYNRPMCLLERALYGHPESGAHWEHHLKLVLQQMQGVSVDGHHSLFWFPQQKLLLCVYVDDLLLSGPAENHQWFWKRVREKIDTEDPEPLDRFLGRTHVVI